MDANQQPDEAYRGADPFAVLRSRTSSRARAPGCSKGMTAERSAFANANPRDKLWVYHRGPRCPARRFWSIGSPTRTRSPGHEKFGIARVSVHGATW